jgi:hypothetical protein
MHLYGCAPAGAAAVRTGALWRVRDEKLGARAKAHRVHAGAASTCAANRHAGTLSANLRSATTPKKISNQNYFQKQTF